MRVAALDHRAHVLEDHVAARALREAVTHLLADHLVLIGAQARGLGVGHGNRLDGHPRLVEEQRRFLVLGAIGGASPTGTGGDLLSRGRRRGFGYRQLAQVHLMRVGLDDPLLALLPEDLALEPVQLMLGRRQFAAQLDDLLRAVSRRFIEAENAWSGR